jgi:catechol 2,3-dioxygenase-like lactoylglutathione lyase family enzyme
MAITGIAAATFGVEDLAETTRFFTDFGLKAKVADQDETVFALDEGSEVIVRAIDDPALPAAWFKGNGVREVIWGVDSREALEALVRDIASDRQVDEKDGVVRFKTDEGIPFGLKVWQRNRVTYKPDAVNAPGSIGRFNQMRRWRDEARPKCINHVVFKVNDYEKAFAFMETRLNFRLTDAPRGRGKFGRADGTNEHHNIFFRNLRPGEDIGFEHLAFSVEDIDEMMAGANNMARKGWSGGRLGRHRISSALFYYLKGPAGGEIEYNCDQDVVDDSYVPREWEPVFGNWHWAYPLPPVLEKNRSEWDAAYIKSDK